MNVLVPLSIGLAILWFATRSYSKYIANKIGVDPGRSTPAHQFKDGRDYVPTSTHVVFAHHFSVIAGASPIVGPTLAIAFGYAPSWLWIVFGCVLFGAVHDMTSMFVSMREGGFSMADMSRRTLGKAGYFLFVAFLVLILTLINAIFLNLSCKALTSNYPLTQLHLPPDTTLLRTYLDSNGVLVGRIGGIATTSVFVITFFAPFMGYLVHRKRWPMPVMYVIAAAVCFGSVLIGFKFPVFLDEKTWRYVMSAYVFIACWIPVWLILQPRDFVNVQILYGGLIIMAVGTVFLGLKGAHIQADFINLAQGAQKIGPIWPALFITVACGAISGFHSLAASGTTVKQISSEKDVQKVGYNAMILEGCLALLSLMLISTALGREEYFQIVYPSVGAGNPILAYAMAMGYMLNQVFSIPVAIGAVMGILVVEGFVVTTLDTALRLCRYMLQEFWNLVFEGRAPKVFMTPLFNTMLAVGLMLFFALNSTIYSAWTVFGAGNQLIAALAMTIVTVWLLQHGKSYWFTLVPAVAMFITTVAMLSLTIRKRIIPAAPGGEWTLKADPLVISSALLLVLAVGVVIVSVRRFIQARNGHHIPAAESAGG